MAHATVVAIMTAGLVIRQSSEVLFLFGARDDLGHAEVSVRGFGRLFERELLAERGARRVFARGVGALALGREAADGGLDGARVELVQLLDVGDYGRDLRRELVQLLVRDFEVRERGDFLNVGFGYRHAEIFISDRPRGSCNSRRRAGSAGAGRRREWPRPRRRVRRL